MLVGFVGIVIAAFVFEVTQSNPDPKGIAEGLFIPGFDGTESVLLATGILGATVMPHVVYLHSALTQRRVVGRNDAERKQILNFEKVDVVIAMTLAGLVNMSMVVVAAGLFNAGGLIDIDSIEGAYAGLQQTVSDNAATIFGVALLASGLASTSVGTMAGQVVMQGFIKRRIPLTLRRAITLAPALVVLAIGVDPTRALVVSQVVLSFGIPFALIPLLVIARRRRVMGAMVNPGLAHDRSPRCSPRRSSPSTCSCSSSSSSASRAGRLAPMALSESFQEIVDVAPARLDRHAARSPDQ